MSAKCHDSTSILDLPCSNLQGVGPKVSSRLEKLNIHTLKDLIFHLPFRYQDRTHIVPLGTLRFGMQVAIEGVVELSEFAYHGKTRFLTRMSDGTGFLTLRFFHVAQYQKQMLARGTKIRCYGEIRFGPTGYEMIHPEFQRIDEKHPLPVEETLTPIYSTTDGLHQISLRKIIDQALNLLMQQSENEKNDCLQEIIPEKILLQFLSDQKNKIPVLKDILLFLHRPPAYVSTGLIMDGQHPYQKRLAFEELLAHYLSLRQLRVVALNHQAIPLTTNGQLIQKFIETLPFSLTAAQQRVILEIQSDLENNAPMLRLVQGDVGSGKTIVAAIAVLSAVDNHKQAVIMAPTELLAEQHLKNFSHWFKPLNIQVAWLSGQVKGKARESVLTEIKNGEAQIIVGTHALFQESVEFNDLALLIIDEQHRFGVHQRLALREKGIKQNIYPHQLIMTATPIPRTLAMCAYADLDQSIIDELPPGRMPVKTIVVSNKRRSEVIQHIRESYQKKCQVYWVCPLIEESEVLQCQAAEKTSEQLSKVLPELKVGLVHGHMKSKEKEDRMTLFKKGEIDLLVATTVIEVGVDVSNATLMVIENPERLGLAQLHQLRGRVGRGSVESHCVLLYQNPLSDLTKKRLTIMRENHDGFVIAQKDLELRGPGEVLGTRQTGLMQMKVADIVRDQALLPQVKKTAQLILAQYPDHAQKLIDRWISYSKEYGHV